MITVHRKGFCLTLFLWIFIIEATTFYIQSNTVDNIFQCTFCLCMLFLILRKGCRYRLIVSRTLILYIMLVMSAFVHDLAAWDMAGLREGIARFLLLILLAYMDNTFTDSRKIPEGLFVFPVIYGGMISVQGILLQAINFFGAPMETNRTIIDKFQVAYDMEKHGLGVVMYNGGNFLGREMLRIYGYYIEPAKMAAFLLIPIFFSWGLYQKSHRRIYKYTMVLCLCGFLQTFSRAGLVALIGALIIGKIVGKRGSHLQTEEQTSHFVAGRKDLLRLAVSGILFLMAAVVALNLLVALSKFFPDFRILYHGITNEQGKVNLIRKEGVDLAYISQLMIEKPLGYGFLGNARLHTNLANAFAFWLVCGGLPGAVLAVVLMCHIMLKLVIPALKSQDPLKVAAANAFTALAIQNLSYGKWSDVDFLFLIGLLAALKRTRAEDITVS